MDRKHRLAVLATHPIQYQAPLFRKIANHPQIDLKVYYCWNFGVASGVDPGFQVELKWDIPLLNGYAHTFMTNFSPRPGFSFLGQINPGIISELWRNRYDAILIHGYTAATSLLALLGGWLTRTPIMFRGEADILKPRSLGKKIVKRILLVPAFKTVSAVLYSCTSNKWYYEQYGVPAHKMFFFPCAVDNDFLGKALNELKPRKHEIRQQLGIPLHSTVLLFVGKLIRRKRPMDILRAYEVLRNRNNAWLVFVGDGPEKRSMLDYISRKGLNQVHIAGFRNQSELPVFYTMSDVFVMASEHDPSPKVINEAMNFGLPLVVSDRVGTAPDLVRAGENGFIYPAGDIEALAGCLSKVLNNPEMAQQMGDRSAEIVSEWSFDQDVHGILEALEYVTRDSGG